MSPGLLCGPPGKVGPTFWASFLTRTVHSSTQSSGSRADDMNEALSSVPHISETDHTTQIHTGNKRSSGESSGKSEDQEYKGGGEFPEKTVPRKEETEDRFSLF